jgi:serpin B
MHSLIPLAMTLSLAQPVEPDVPSVVKGSNVFALDLYARLGEDKGNLFLSPYSISNALAMTYAGARGKTAEEMATTLHFSLEPKKLHPSWAALIHKLNSPDAKRPYQLTVANALWGQKGYHWQDDFLQITKKSYGAGLHEVDFVKATEEARRTINAWVEKQTNDRIKELLKRGVLTADARLVLTNAIYFKAAWDEPFEPKLTTKKDFNVTKDQKVAVEMMRNQKHFSYFETDQFQMLELPYERPPLAKAKGKFIIGRSPLSMIVFLPKTVDGLTAFEKNLTSARLDEWLGKMKPRMVALELPKFKFTAEFSLKKTLSAMGMPTAFDARAADFSGMTTREPLFISDVVHKAYVDVHEKGTEAAAATAVLIFAGGLPPPPVPFVADRPFCFLIRENTTGSILFIGRVANP